MSEKSHELAVVHVDAIAPAERMHPLVKAAVATGALDPATLAALLEVQKNYEANEARKLYTCAFVALHRDLPKVIAKDQTVDFRNKAGVRTRYTHTSLAAMADAITEPLTAHGFALSTPAENSNELVTVTARLTHTGGHSEECTMSAPPDMSGSKSLAQGIASTSTLLARYASFRLLGLASADMKEPEGEAPARAASSGGSTVNPDRNLRAVTRLAEHGRTAAQAEAYLCRSVARWTADDIDRLQAWVLDDGAAREPGDDEEQGEVGP